MNSKRHKSRGSPCCATKVTGVKDSYCQAVEQRSGKISRSRLSLFPNHGSQNLEAELLSYRLHDWGEIAKNQVKAISPGVSSQRRGDYFNHGHTSASISQSHLLIFAR